MFYDCNGNFPCATARRRVFVYVTFICGRIDNARHAACVCVCVCTVRLSLRVYVCFYCLTPARVFALDRSRAMRPLIDCMCGTTARISDAHPPPSLRVAQRGVIDF